MNTPCSTIRRALEKAPVVLCTLAAAVTASLGQALLPPPVPSPNPITETKRVLGKIIFTTARD